MVLQFLKPILFVWAGLNALDDVAKVMKITRLVGSSLSPFRRDESKDSMCDLCDDIVAGLLAGNEGLQAVPCSWMCLRVPKCMRMCENIKETTETSAKFPCVAAGYCADEVADEDDVYGIALTQMECEKGPLFACEPKKYCRRQRHGWRYRCNPKPGVGRWVGMQKAAATHTAALAAGFLNRKHCGEQDAGPFCIAAPKGLGKLAEVVGALLSLIYGGYYSIVAIETPGGDDDQQWLTFWIILVGSMFLEKAIMQVLLSKFPFYYEVKLLLLLWLMFFGGATHFYRRFRKKLENSFPYFEKILNHRSHDSAKRQLDILTDIGGDLIVDQIQQLEKRVKRNPGRRSSAYVIRRALKDDELSWEYDYADVLRRPPEVHSDAAETLYVLSKWLLSSEGFDEMKKRDLSQATVALLLERAAALISFNPRYLNIHLIGTKPGPDGSLPSMDRNKAADCYVKFYIRPYKNSANGGTPLLYGLDPYPDQVVRSRIQYNKHSPQWNEKLELLIKGGNIDSDGHYRDRETKQKVVVAEAWDADVGMWGIGLDMFWISFFLVTLSLFVGHVTGVLDSFLDHATTPQRAWLEMGIVALIVTNVVGLTMCYLKSVIFRADDEFMGSCDIPLDILLDQREHALCCNLQKAEVFKGVGILRVRLSLSE
jgi:receptor expression-enhancing protein 5/6